VGLVAIQPLPLQRSCRRRRLCTCAFHVAMDGRRWRSFVASCPVVDHHCHVICEGKAKLETCVSEAQGSAQEDARYTLAAKRAVRRLSKLLGCERSFESVQETRNAIDTVELARLCFEEANIQAILVDDGLVAPNMWSLNKHKEVVKHVYRVARIERIAEETLEEYKETDTDQYPGWQQFQALFESNLAVTIKQDNVVSWKTIAAYRCGLAALGMDFEISEVEQAYNRTVEAVSADNEVRLSEPSLISWCVKAALRCASKASKCVPLQIHTGFGDTDLDLQQANPLLLKPFLEREDLLNIPVVVLHAGYPFTRDAGHLCSVHKNCFLDLGLAIPMLSQTGIEQVIRMALELCPSNKLLFSTDAHFMPEGFYIAVADVRESLLNILTSLLSTDEICEVEAIGITQALLWKNACTLYNLPVQPTNGESPMPLQMKSKVEILQVLWCDSAGITRCKAVPATRLDWVAQKGIGLTKACMGSPAYTDAPSPKSGLSPVGEINVVPDADTLRFVPWKTNHALSFGYMKCGNGQAWEYCPRSRLSQALQSLREFGINLQVGFEIEFILLKVSPSTSGSLEPVDDSGFCSATSFNQRIPFLDDLLVVLGQLDLQVRLLHAESARGQFEVSMQHGDAMSSADGLLLARLSIASIASKHGCKAAFLPKVFLGEAGNGCHLNVSLWDNTGGNLMSCSGKTGRKMSSTSFHFMGGIFHHLDALTAILAPSPLSYDRLAPDEWSGAYKCWGYQNREAPLRAISCGEQDPPLYWEIKTMDSTSNPYLAIAAVIAAGLDGLSSKRHLPPPVQMNPSTASMPLEFLPRNFKQATACLMSEKAEPIRRMLGEELITAFVAANTDNDQHFADKSFEEQVSCLLQRY